MPKAKTPRTANPTKRVISLVPAKLPNSSSSVSKPETLEEEIRRRAYELYERRGRTPGRESEDWLVAEQEVVARYQELAGAKSVGA